MLEIKITMQEDGTFKLYLDENLPIFVAIGALEVAKNMLITDNINTIISDDIKDTVKAIDSGELQ